MRKELAWDYDITVDNMVPMTKEQEIDGFKVEEAEFISMKTDDTIKMDVLVRNWEQIYHMKDGKYILEVEDEEMEISYFYSNKIEDLV